MHLVGPRAEWINLADQYSKNIINYNYRHIVRPGITGWAQIIYPYGTMKKMLDKNSCMICIILNIGLSGLK